MNQEFHCGPAATNSTNIREDVDSIPGSLNGLSILYGLAVNCSVDLRSGSSACAEWRRRALVSKPGGGACAGRRVAEFQEGENPYGKSHSTVTGGLWWNLRGLRLSGLTWLQVK